MNIAFIIYDSSRIGGAERVSYNLIKEFAPESKITYISIFKKNFEQEYPVIPGVNYEILINKKSCFSRHIMKILVKTRKILKSNSVDIVVAMGMSVALITILSTRKTNIKTIICEHSSIFNKVYANRVMRINQRIGALYCNKLVVLNEVCKKGYLEKYKISPTKVKVIHNWIEQEAFIAKDYNWKRKKIVTVGRADPVKGFDKLIEIAKRIKPYAVGWEWHIWGDFSSEYGKFLIQKAQDEGLQDFLCFQGVAKNMYTLYQNYSMLVMTSLYEGLPMVLLEAKANRLPLVSFDCLTGPSEIIQNNLNGKLVPAGNTDEMVKTLIYLINNPEVLEEYSNCSDKNLENFSKAIIINQWRQVFNSLL